MDIRGISYPKTHDLNALLQLLENNGNDVETFWDLVEFNDFAVQFRYDLYETTDAPLDRKQIIEQVTGLFRHVEFMLK